MGDQEREVSTRRAKNIGSKVCHCLLIIPLLAVMALASISLGIFVVKIHEINVNGTDCCIQYMYATDDFSLSVCDVSIWGEGALVVLGAILAVGMIIKTVAGVRVLNPLLILELIIVGMGLLGGLAFALNTTIGFAVTSHGSKSCSDFMNGSSSILESEVAAWLAAVILLLLFVIYVTLLVAYCRKCVRRGRDHPQYLTQYDNLCDETIALPSQNPFDYESLNQHN